MYIKSIVLDGFKSYRSRTEVAGFDPKFNAITGLNGTGKSNILDSICFVLGISNLTHVRAEQLQDLVYKNGQAGVLKATVSITFDNSDKNQCPPGYEEHREITVTRQVVIAGKNKYMINGATVQNKVIQDLFCSVQLNVNNPNFLIMQGRITKVLNMKPPQILSLIQEAAGTSIYETKRVETVKMIEKKDSKLASIVNIVENEIKPKLEKLKEERKQYTEFQRIERDKEYAYRLFIISTMENIKLERAEFTRELTSLRNEIAALDGTVESNTNQIAKIESEINELSNKIDQETGGQLSSLQNKLKEKETVETAASDQVKSWKTEIAAQEKKKKQLDKSLKDDIATLNTKTKEMDKLKEMFLKLKETQEADSAALALAQQKLEAAITGQVVNEAGEAETMQSQLISYQTQQSEAEIRTKKCEMELKVSLEQLATKQRLLKNTSADSERENRQQKELEAAVARTQKELQRTGYTDEQITDLSRRRVDYENQIGRLNNNISNFESNYMHIVFRYKDPVPNFDRRSVLGLVSERFTVPDIKKFGLALEVTAGSKMYDVIVDTEKTSKLLIGRGQLNRRCTFIPLNKIRSRTIRPDVVRAAQQIAGSDNVQSAMDLIQFDEVVRPAMEYIFGSVLICSTLDIASTVAFHPRVRTKCITLEGDAVDPAGVMSTGINEGVGTLLLAMKNIEKVKSELAEAQKQVKLIENELRNVKQFQQIKNEHELAKHKLNQFKNELQHNEYYNLKNDVETLTTTVNDLRTEIQENKKKITEYKNKIINIQQQIGDNNPEKQLKEAQKEVDVARKKAENSKKEWSKKENVYENLELEITEIEKGIETTKASMAEIEAIIATKTEELTGYQDQLEEASREVTELKNDIAKNKKDIETLSKEVSKMNSTKKKLTDQINEVKLEKQRRILKLEQLETNNKEWDAREQEVAKKNKNILSDKKAYADYLGLSDTEKSRVKKRYEDLKEKHHQLSRRVNKSAFSMLEEEENKFLVLLERKRTIEENKQALLDSITDLDTKKEKAIFEAWQEVDKNFDSIFGTLLPGSNARLTPPEGKTVQDGLEVRVSLGGVWKESLSELSGGQRSLIALSLILSMLLFNPAPLYILDEIDAALDLSHTQNIGNMLRTHFKASQFIIVSLKDGMFNNANVLFKTHFADGVSNVTRTVCRK